MYKEAGMDMYFTVDALPWEEHPSVRDVSIKKIITMTQFGQGSPSIIMVRIPAGIEVPEHIHANSEDILFILAGLGTMWIDGAGIVRLRKDAVVRVPHNTKHRIYEVTEELLIYDVFSPGIM
jgi:mannose-6-phosphate isomerase-like protein (cupin superfamily)